MRNDPFFKFVAVIIVAGVLIALVAPSHTTANATTPVLTTALTAHSSHDADNAQ